MADAIIVALTASLVREYLSRKGLKSTLQTLDKELPRTEESISNRAQLAKEMHIEKLMKKNKELPEPFRTMLEVIVRFMRERDIQNSTSSHVGTERSNQRLNSTRDSKRESRRKTTAQPSNDESDTHSDKQEIMDNRKDNYDELLKRLERPVRSVSSSKTSSKTSNTDLRSSDQRDRQREETNAGILDKPDGRVVAPSHEGSSLLFGDGTARLKNKRRLNTSMGGPVVSSGLVAVRKDARTRHSTGRVNDGFSSKRVGSLLDYDQGPKKEEVDMQSKNQEEVDHNVDLHSSGNDFPLDQMGHHPHHQTEVSTTRTKIPRSQTNSTRNQLVPSNSRSQKIKNNDLVFEDIDDDFDQELAQLSLGPRKIAPADLESKPISLETAMGLKTLIFGNGKASFAPEWRKQGFSFCDLYGLEYGIVQLKGGPCGVLASVQGFVLKHLLFGVNKGDVKKKLHPSLRERTKALASAISEILWRAGDNKRATVALATGGSNVFGAGRYKPDQLTETLVLYAFKTSESLQNFISQNITQFESDTSSGCILLLYSVILSRTIERVRSDMDEPNGTLMGAHGYCTQEMVNLFLTGKAVSNTFDNVMEIDTGGAEKNIFKGLEKQSEIGLLSLFEHYKSCEVGMNFKNPKFPVWVICSESHFSILFSAERNLLDDLGSVKKFDLYYYDGLARQDEELRLTVDTARECPDYKDTDLVPPLEHCIRTRWKNAVVDWNGSDPIL
ncbi:putative ubiquitin carboxyl-terminal hydrolase MINDY-4 isoform X1 [Acropora palmata]|uniref:putative ubiquitin carboxyl-terminal hydrolase MINDY-4 isoform X1 n=1 Tax=Acropora palmata TaxID=6131 RepID=UPI003DA09775